MAAAAILNLVGGFIENKQKSTENANAAIATLQKEATEKQKELKIWRTVFFASIVVALILVVVLIVTSNSKHPRL